jgi:hypothetical protein
VSVILVLVGPAFDVTQALRAGDGLPRRQVPPRDDVGIGARAITLGGQLGRVPPSALESTLT